MRRTWWTWAAVALLIGGAGLFLFGPHEPSFAMVTLGHVPPPFVWMPRYRLVGIAVFIAGIVVLAASTAYAAGVRKGRSGAS